MKLIAHVTMMIVLAACGGRLAIAQDTPESARVAAARFAFTGAFRLQPESVVVLVEPGWNRTDVPNVTAISQRLTTEADKIARVIGPSVKVVRAEQALTCIRKECAAEGQQTIVAVTEPERDGGQWTVLVRAWMPSKDQVKEPRGTTVGMLVEVRQDGNGWRAVKTLLGPSVAPVRARD